MFIYLTHISQRVHEIKLCLMYILYTYMFMTEVTVSLQGGVVTVMDYCNNEVWVSKPTTSKTLSLVMLAGTVMGWNLYFIPSLNSFHISDVLPWLYTIDTTRNKSCCSKLYIHLIISYEKINYCGVLTEKKVLYTYC